jgi:hypothetical protein
MTLRKLQRVLYCLPPLLLKFDSVLKLNWYKWRMKIKLDMYSTDSKEKKPHEIVAFTASWIFSVITAILQFMRKTDENQRILLKVIFSVKKTGYSNTWFRLPELLYFLYFVPWNDQRKKKWLLLHLSSDDNCFFFWKGCSLHCHKGQFLESRRKKQKLSIESITFM